MACEIFRQEVEHLLESSPELPAPGEVDIEWQPPALHVDLDKLKSALDNAFSPAAPDVVLYGACHPDLDAMMQEGGGQRPPAKNCIAAFLPEEERKELEERRAFIMSPGWLRNWQAIFHEGLGWDEIDARMNFGFYDIIVLLDFGLEPIDEMMVLEFFEYAQVPVEVHEADLKHFKQTLEKLLAENSP